MRRSLLCFPSLGILLFGFVSNVSGQIWNTQIADSTGIAKGSYISFALDKNDNAHILYQDLDLLDLKYVTNKNGSWKITNLDTFGISGTESSMAIDQDDRLHICFHRDPGVLNVNSIIYGQYANNQWTFEEVDTTRDIALIQTDINTYKDEKVAVIYAHPSQDKLIYAEKSGTEWNKETVDANFSGLLSRLLFKKDGTPVICSITDDTVSVYHRNSSVWQVKKLYVAHAPVLPPIRTFDVAIDSEDNLHFTCNVLDPDYITFCNTSYYYYNWQDLSVHELGMSGLATPLSIFVDPKDDIYVFTVDTEFVLYKNTTDQWERIAITDEVSPEGNASLKMDSHNNPYIAFFGLPDNAPHNKQSYVMCFRYFSSSPVIETTPESISFGDVWVNSYSDEYITIANKSNIPLTVKNIQPENTTVFISISASLPKLLMPWQSTTFQLRFNPDLISDFNDAILIYSDDIYNPVDTVNVTGSGVDNDAQGTLKLKVNDVYFSEEYLALNYTQPAEDVSVSLYQNNIKVAGPVTTDHNGLSQLPDLAQGHYIIKASKQIFEPNGNAHEVTVNQNIEIGPAVNSASLSFPDSLLTFKYKLMHDLKHISPQKYGHLNNYSYVGDFTYKNSLAGIYDMMDNWNQYMTDQKAQSLARLILVEQFTYDLFKDGTITGSDMMNCFGDLIAYIYYSDDWGMDLIKFLKAIAKLPAGGAQELYDLLLQILMRELIKLAVIDNVDMTVKFVAGEVGYPAAKPILNGWKLLKKNYAGFGIHGFSEVKWDKIAGMVFEDLEEPFIQLAYINAQTGMCIEKAGQLSLKLDQTGTLEDAIIKKIEFIRDEKSATETVHTYSDGLRTAAALMMQTAAILDWISTLDPTGIGNYLEQAAFYIKASAYVEVGTALTISTVTYFLMPLEMRDAVDKIYYPYGTKSINLNNTSLLTAERSISVKTYTNPLSLRLKESSTSFNTELETIRTKITDSQEWEAVKSLFDLREAELAYEKELKNAMYPVLSGAHLAHQTIPGFETEYDTLVANYTNSAMNRLNAYLTIITLAADSSDATKEKVLAYIDTCMSGVQKLADQTNHVLNLISDHIQLEASIAANNLSQSAFTVNDDEESVVSFKVKNYGDSATSGVSARFSPGPGLTVLGSDSVYIGDLQPGQESDELTFTLFFTTDTLKQSVWNIDFTTTHGHSFPADGILIYGNNTGTQNKPPTLPAMVSSYPNPADNNVVFKFDLNSKKLIKIEVFNQLGQLISMPLHKTVSAGEYTFDFSTALFSNGTYLCRISVDDAVIETKQIVVIH
ncbi:T9SS type A sorting domain-containing protein [Saccharicrinis sp. FJH2]|uniref:T9SS type A sorting domain-containing protein n=1 Tax=Saccharicrinis sp. FJH65 TaxID=3344659 RepID=UPI0035F2E709